MTQPDPQIEQRVIALLAAHARTPITPTAATRIVADTQMDSVAVMDFVLEIEDAFDLTIPLNRIAEIVTVGDLVRELTQIRTTLPTNNDKPE